MRQLEEAEDAYNLAEATFKSLASPLAVTEAQAMFRRRVEKGKDDPVVEAFIATKLRIREKYYSTKLHVSSLRFLIENPTTRFFSSFFLLLFSLLLTF